MVTAITRTKSQVLCNTGFSYQVCWHTDLVSFRVVIGAGLQGDFELYARA